MLAIVWVCWWAWNNVTLLTPIQDSFSGPQKIRLSDPLP
jgi:hypothetical protein